MLTDIVRMREKELAAGKEVDFGAAPSHVHIHVVAMAVAHVLDMVVVNDPGFFLPVDNLYLDARAFLYLGNNLLAVGSIAHGRCGASAVIVHLVDFHQKAVSLHQAEHLVDFHQKAVSLHQAEHLAFFLRTDLAGGEHIETQAQRHAQHAKLGKLVCRLFVNLLYQEPDGVRPDVDGRVSQDFLLCLFHFQSINDRFNPNKDLCRYISG